MHETWQLAYVRPKGRRRAQLILDGLPYPVEAFSRTLVPSEGFHRVRFRWHNTRAEILELQPPEPSSPDELMELLRLMPELPSQARELMAEVLRGLSLEEALAHLTNPLWLQTFRGIGPQRAERIAQRARLVSDSERRLVRLLSRLGIPPERGARWYEYLRRVAERDLLNEDAIADNPYRLLDLADPDIIEQVGFSPGRAFTFAWVDERLDSRWRISSERLEAVLPYLVRRAMLAGEAWLYAQELSDLVRRSGQHIVVFDGRTASITPELVLGFARMLESLDVAAERIAPAGSLEWAREARDTLKLLADRRPLILRSDRELIMARIGELGVRLTREQQRAVQAALESSASLVTGQAGSGKTTTLQALVQAAGVLLEARRAEDAIARRTFDRTAYQLYLLAPTGAAAQRMRMGLGLEGVVRASCDTAPDRLQYLTRGHVEIGTIHAWLGWRGGSCFQRRRPQPAIIFVDESSMLDEIVFRELLRQVRTACDLGIPQILVFLGDVRQLPPVGPGYPMRDLIDMGLVPVTQLTRVMRQSEGSLIVEAAHAILEGRLPPQGSPERGFRWVNLPQRATSASVLLERWSERLRKAGFEATPEDVQLILPLRNPSRIEPEAPNVRRINRELQEYFAGRRGLEPVRLETDMGPERLAVGDRVVHVGLNSFADGQVNRGAIGRVLEVEPRRVRVVYEALGVEAVYEQEDLWQLDLAWAVTCHSAQGSEFRHVVIMLPRHAARHPITGSSMIDRAWLYTAVTRGRESVLLVASQERVEHALSLSSHRRTTFELLL